MKKDLKRIEMVIEDEEDAIFKLSMVDRPAIKIAWVALKDQVEIKLSVDTDEHIITGPVLIPNEDIYRDATFEGGESNIFFSADTIRKCANMFLTDSDKGGTTIQHLLPTNKAKLIESWVIRDSSKDLSAALGYNLPVGTWMASMKVTDDDLWNEVKEGTFTGFSVEGLFTLQEVDLSENWTPEEQEELADYILSKKLITQ